jgi:uncharacterized protein
MADKIKLILRVSEKCNQNCFYCYVDRDKRRNSREVLGFFELEVLFKKILTGKFSYIQIVWHGGEPTLLGAEYFEKAIQLQQKHCAEGVKVENNLQTNLSALNKELVEVFVKHNIAIGVSLDAPPRIHNKMRVFWSGRSTLKKCLEGIEILKKFGLKPSAICVLHKENLEFCNEIYNFFKSIKVNYKLNPFYKDESTPQDVADKICITPEQYADALLETFELYVGDNDHQIDVTDLKEMMMSMVSGYSCNCLFSGNCKEFFGIAPNGDIYFCDLFYRPEYYLGNIQSVVFEDLNKTDLVKSVANRVLVLKDTHCRNCKWWQICHGGCTTRSVAFYGNIFQADPFCIARKKLFDRMYKFLQENKRREVSYSGESLR